MRPVVAGITALAAAAVSAALSADLADRPPGGGDSDVRAPGAAAPAPTPGFFAPPSFEGPAAPTSGAPPPVQYRERELEPHEFYFTRAMYSDGRSDLRDWGRRRSRGSWATDWPKADHQFIVVVKRLANLDAYDWENAVSLADPAVRNFPFLYALEVGAMSLTEAEVEGLRDYLAAGGFLVIDDFWGDREWDNFEREIRRVLPSRPIEDLSSLEHPIFRAFYDIEEIRRVPEVNRGMRGEPYYSECGACQPTVRGIFDEDGRLMVIIHWNTDLGDAWEHAENPFYPLDRSTFAYEMGVNMIVYAMSH